MFVLFIIFKVRSLGRSVVVLPVSYVKAFFKDKALYLNWSKYQELLESGVRLLSRKMHAPARSEQCFLFHFFVREGR